MKPAVIPLSCAGTRWLIGGLLVLLVMVSLVALGIGSAASNWHDLHEGFFGAADNPMRVILLDVRLPRLVLAVLIGAVLGLAGAALQGLLKNPLADPGVLGVSAGAALGAVLLFYTGWAASTSFLLPAGSVLGALLAAGLLLALAGREATLQTLVLAGLALNSLFGALITLTLNLSPNPFANMEVLFWLMGSLTDRSWSHVTIALPFFAAGSICLLATGPALRALSLGEDTAVSLGFDLRRTRLLVITGTTLVVGASVAVAGAISFVGLMVPHLLRPLAKGDPGRLLGLSALGGAILLPAADIGVRLLRVGPELKLGVVTALLGAPFFLVLLLKQRSVSS